MGVEKPSNDIHDLLARAWRVALVIFLLELFFPAEIQGHQEVMTNESAGVQKMKNCEAAPVRSTD